MAEKKVTKPTCPHCTSRQVLFRRKDRLYWCRVCGRDFTTPKMEKQYAD